MDDDPLTAALQMRFPANGTNGSFFPGAKLFAQDSKLDLIKDADSTFFGGVGPSPSPTPKPSPTPTKPTQMSLADLYNHFGVPNYQQGGLYG